MNTGCREREGGDSKKPTTHSWLGSSNETAARAGERRIYSRPAALRAYSLRARSLRLHASALNAHAHGHTHATQTKKKTKINFISCSLLLDRSSAS